MREKKIYYFFIHILFTTGIFYAFGQFITTPRSEILERRLWAYESWIIASFYALFVILTLTEKELRLKKIKKPKVHLNEFKRILSVNLLLLVFPWGLFLLLAPQDLLDFLGIGSIYLRILGGMSLLGAALYYYPYRFYNKKLSYYVLVFGAFDNLLAGLILSVLFVMGRVNLLAFSSAPLLFYFAGFFHEQSTKYRELVKKKKA